MREQTTLRADVEALYLTGNALARLQLPAAVAIPSRGATGDPELDDVLGAFCRRYNRLVDTTGADHAAATEHLHATAAGYADTDTAAAASLTPTPPPDPHQPTPEPAHDHPPATRA